MSDRSETDIWIHDITPSGETDVSGGPWLPEQDALAPVVVALVTAAVITLGHSVSGIAFALSVAGYLY